MRWRSIRTAATRTGATTIVKIIAADTGTTTTGPNINVQDKCRIVCNTTSHSGTGYDTHGFEKIVVCPGINCLIFIVGNTITIVMADTNGCRQVD